MPVFTCGEVRARRSTCPFCPSFLPSFLPHKRLKEAFRGQTSTETWVIEATESIWVHLRSLEAVWRSFEAVWRPFGGQRSITRGRKHNRGLLAACLSCLSKAASFEVIWGHLEAVLRPNMTKDSQKKFTKLKSISYITSHCTACLSSIALLAAGSTGPLPSSLDRTDKML